MGKSMLAKKEKDYLLGLARQAILNNLTERNNPLPEISELSELKKLNSPLLQHLGCFVTLKSAEGQLRGCIGVIESERPLVENVVSYAVIASQEDPRFAPVGLHELNELQLEISVMGKIEKVPSLESIVIGKHGLIMKQGRRQGLLLPQVPIEWGWNLIQFLEHTCQKAGLKSDAYKDPQTEIFYFSAEVFGEKDD